jgi:hypothetical protein
MLDFTAIEQDIFDCKVSERIDLQERYARREKFAAFCFETVKIPCRQSRATSYCTTLEGGCADDGMCSAYRMGASTRESKISASCRVPTVSVGNF